MIENLELGKHFELKNKKWIEQLDDLGTTPFLNLKALKIDCAEPILELLTPKIRTIKNVEVRIQRPVSARSFNALYSLPALQKVGLYSHSGGNIEGTALVELARSCPLLTEIMISDHFNGFKGATISDYTIELVARSLPGLKIIKIEVKSSNMTEEAVLHLGRSCNSLRRISLVGYINLMTLANRGFPRMFSKLRSCRLQLLESSAHRVRGMSSKEANVTAERLLRVMSNCSKAPRVNGLIGNSLFLHLPAMSNAFERISNRKKAEEMHRGGHGTHTYQKIGGIPGLELSYAQY